MTSRLSWLMHSVSEFVVNLDSADLTGDRWLILVSRIHRFCIASSLYPSRLISKVRPATYCFVWRSRNDHYRIQAHVVVNM